MSQLNPDFHILFQCIAGSHLYGTNTETSDIDTRGVFVPTQEYFLGFMHKIEQQEDKTQDNTFYELRQFFKLCAECNPNIVEMLFVPKEKAVVWTSKWDWLVDCRHLFLSKKARYTFSGYAIAQLKRIELHRRWLLHPPKKQPLRSDFGLPEDRALVSKDQINAYEELKNQGKTDYVTFGENALEALQREKAFLNANREWGQYQNWKTNRNLARAELEAKFGFDLKHASHLARLISEGKELLLTGNIAFPRPDAKFLLDIRHGKYTYDELMAMVGDLDAKFDEYYEKSPLPHSPNQKDADNLCISIVRAVLF